MHSVDQMRPKDSEMQEELARLAAEMQLGQTGQFPEGKITPSDQGELRLAVGVFKGKVTMNFGTPVQALGLSAEQARCLADILRARANQLDPQRKRHGGK